MGSHSVTCHPTERGDIPALTPAEAGTRLSDPGVTPYEKVPELDESQ